MRRAASATLRAPGSPPGARGWHPALVELGLATAPSSSPPSTGDADHRIAATTRAMALLISARD